MSKFIVGHTSHLMVTEFDPVIYDHPDAGPVALWAGSDVKFVISADNTVYEGGVFVARHFPDGTMWSEGLRLHQMAVDEAEANLKRFREGLSNFLRLAAAEGKPVKVTP